MGMNWKTEGLLLEFPFDHVAFAYEILMKHKTTIEYCTGELFKEIEESSSPSRCDEHDNDPTSPLTTVTTITHFYF